MAYRPYRIVLFLHHPVATSKRISSPHWERTNICFRENNFFVLPNASIWLGLPYICIRITFRCFKNQGTNILIFSQFVFADLRKVHSNKSTWWENDLNQLKFSQETLTWFQGLIVVGTVWIQCWMVPQLHIEPYTVNLSYKSSICGMSGKNWLACCHLYCGYLQWIQKAFVPNSVPWHLF